MTIIENTLAQAEELVHSTTRELERINSERRKAVAEATRVVEDEFRDRCHAASFARANAIEARDNVRIAGSRTNPMVGKKVMKTKNKAVSKWSSRTHAVTVYGIVEVMAPGTEMPANMGNWRRPDNGEVFVRLLKGDGTPGLKIENLFTGWSEVP